MAATTSHDASNALTMPEFVERFGRPCAASENGLRHVTSALTRHHYIRYSYASGDYIVERR